MAGNASGPSNVIAGINMTPLVDIMLVLLIIFLVTAKLAVTPPTAIPMVLPRSATGEGVQVVFAVALGLNGDTLVNGQKIASDDALLPLAAAERAQHPDVKAVIQADGHVLHERVIHVLDLLSRAGVAQIAFGVQLTHEDPVPPAR
jgi:biopolymer transport protein ExbD